jgi:hypothetical protein
VRRLKEKDEKSGQGDCSQRVVLAWNCEVNSISVDFYIVLAVDLTHAFSAGLTLAGAPGYSENWAPYYIKKHADGGGVIGTRLGQDYALSVKNTLENHRFEAPFSAAAGL